MTTTLEELQTSLWRAITWPTGVRDYFEHASPKERRSLSESFDETAEFPLLERLEVYAQAYFYRLLGVLEELYPVTRWLLGGTRFHNLVTSYLLESPSTDPDVRAIGNRFPSFLERDPTNRRISNVAEVALVESFINEALDCDDDPVLDASDLAPLSETEWTELRLIPQRAARLFSGHRDFSGLSQEFRARGAGKPDPEPAHAQSPVATKPVHHTLVWRKGLTVRHRTIDAAQSAALRAVFAGEPFPLACERARAQSPELSEADVAQWLGDWIEMELISSIAIAEGSSWDATRAD